MLKTLEQFIVHVNSQLHLKPILPDHPVVICLQAGYKLYFLELSKAESRIKEENQSRINLWIKGDEQSIQSMILGEALLRKLEIQTEIKVTGKLKEILMVESLFRISKSRLIA